MNYTVEVRVMEHNKNGDKIELPFSSTLWGMQDERSVIYTLMRAGVRSDDLKEFEKVIGANKNGSI